MILKGNISVDDHLNVQRFVQLPAPAWLRVFAFLSGIVTVGVALGIGWALLGADGIYVASLVVPVCMVLGMALILVRMKLWRWNIRGRAEIHNLGESTYCLDGDRIRFTGTTFDCVIPIGSIKGIQENAGTRFLVFGNVSGFIVPKEITHGSWDAFKSELLARMAAKK